MPRTGPESSWTCDECGAPWKGHIPGGIVCLKNLLAVVTKERDALLAFKVYTHQRFDEAGVPPEVPESPHTAAGCRVGGRFDWLFAQLAAEKGLREAAEARAAGLATRLAQIKHQCDSIVSTMVLPTQVRGLASDITAVASHILAPTTEQEGAAMPADPIDREPTNNDLLKRGDVKAAIEATVWHCPLRVDLIAALDKLPALDADGRWERLRTFVECQTRKVGPVEIFIAAYEEVLKEMDRLTSGDAAKREGE